MELVQNENYYPHLSAALQHDEVIGEDILRLLWGALGSFIHNDGLLPGEVYDPVQWRSHVTRVWGERFRRMAQGQTAVYEFIPYPDPFPDELKFVS